MGLKKQFDGFINNFSINKVLIIKDKNLSLSTKFLQLGVVIFLLTDLFVNELYQKTEVPSGYTSMWAESNNLNNYHNSTYDFCDNTKYNYIYSNPDWRYTNISCVDLEYAEMHVKGENEIFFLTHFTENEVNITNSVKNTISKRDFFTTGVEAMGLAFDHFYTTSFDEGGNVAKKKIKTVIRNCDDSADAYVFGPGESISLSVKQWLELGCVDLEQFNTGTIKSLNDPLVTNSDYPHFRLTGIDILIKLSYYNMKSISGYSKETSILKVVVNEGWSSKGSSINYINYPKINGDYKNHFVDRYKYGIKFKFLVTGLMGNFNTYNLVTHFVSGKVLLDLCAILVVTFTSTFFANYSKKFKGERVSKVDNQRPKKKKSRDIDEPGDIVGVLETNNNKDTPVEEEYELESLDKTTKTLELEDEGSLKVSKI